MKKRLFALLLALVMALGLTVTAWAEARIETIPYLDENGVLQTKISTDCEIINNLNVPTSWDEGWYVVKGDKTIDGNLNMTDKVHLILTDGCSLTVNGTLGAGTLTVYGQSGGSGKLTVTSKTPNVEYDEQVVRGISASDLTINGGIVTASTVDADEITPATTNNASTTSFGIYAHNLTINGGNVTGKGGNGYASSCGIYLGFDLTINGGTVTATGGTGTSESYGVHSQYGSLTLAGNARLTATGGTADKSYGVYLPGAGDSDSGHAKMTSGTLIAKATATGSNTTIARAMWVSRTFTPPTAPYWWRTVENGAFTKGPDTAYVYSSNKEATYTEITTVDPAPPAAPDAPKDETAAPAQEAIRRQNTAVTQEAAAPAADDAAKAEAIASPKTFDAGVAVYGAMAVLSLGGSAWIIGKKRP